ncbi:YtxH domain-containing protein [Pontibacter harenae]|uniref:YtxH domain-containing protein n=1 Tax=Pontibacter harenae TaxID=2894083 RepID=UPI001E3D6585|nr:YtxH domain-containing protein [Pontibacter harenae]MCC9169047.1 YtxH domain-containing protein [Pontibacter harenae]
MECRSLGEEKGNYATNSSVRQIKQKVTGESKSHSKSSESAGGKVALSVLAGAGVGVLAGMLLAPEKGEVFRKKVSESASKLGSQATKLYSDSLDKVSSWTGKGVETAKSEDLGPEVVGKVKKSPYTDSEKWDDQENKNMINTAKKTPGV